MERPGERLVRKGDYIGGCFFKPESVNGYINGINPGDRSDIMGRFPFSESSVDESMRFARQGGRAWRRVPLEDRVAAIRLFQDQILRYMEPLAHLITRETGKPLWESRQELLSTARALAVMTEHGPSLLEGTSLDPQQAFSEQLPHGVVGLICPFNAPVQTPTIQSAAALLAGNSVVFKPSKFTPGCGQVVAEIWDRCRLPRGVFNLIQGPGKVIGRLLVSHPDLNALVFTGSYATGRQINEWCATRPELPVIMQTGGKATAIVLGDAELEQAVYEVMIGAFMTAGQRHNSTARLIITQDIYEPFMARLLHQTDRIEIGYGLDPEIFMGPLITESLRSRYRKFGREIEAAGHPVLMGAGSERLERRGFYARPAIYRVHWQQGEPFLDVEPPGPTLLVYIVKDWAEAAALHNQVAARSTASVFTELDTEHLQHMRERLRTGTLNINRGTIGGSFRLPSCPQGSSGNGYGNGLELLQQLSHARAQLVETEPFDPFQALPGTQWSDDLQCDDTMDLELDPHTDISEELELS